MPYASGSGRRREEAELAQQADGIHDDAGVLDAGVLDTVILQTVDDNPRTRTARPVAGIPGNSPL